MKPVAILKTGRKIESLDGVTGDYEDWIREGMGLPPQSVRVIDAASGEALPEPQQLSAVVITGSGSMVTDEEPWMRASAEWLREVIRCGVPVLGICFGHQLLAYALGGKVDYNPRGVEVGTMMITLNAQASSDPLFAGLPTQFTAQLSHSQSVISLPPNAGLLASSEMEPHQAFTCGELVWGIQFHPEFDERIIPHFIEYYRERLEEQGRSVDALHSGITATPQCRSLLMRFRQIVDGDVA